MKTCRECFKKNADEADVCVDCGAVLFDIDNDGAENKDQTNEEFTNEEVTTDVIVNEADEANKAVQTDEADETNETDQTDKTDQVDSQSSIEPEGRTEEVDSVVNENETVDPLSEDNQPIKKSMNRILVIIGIVAIALLVFILISQVVARANPVYRTYKGIEKLYDANTMNVAFSIETDVDEIIDDITKEILMQIIVNYNKKDTEIAVAFTTAYQKDEIMDILMLIREDEMFIDIPQVFDKDEYLYYQLDDYMEEYMNTDNLDELKKYQEMIDYSKLDMKLYTEAVYDAIEKSVDSDFSSVTYEIDVTMLLDIVEAVLDVAEDDEDLMVWVQETGIEVLNAMIDDDFEFYDAGEDEWEEALDYIDDSDFEDNWDDGMKLLSDGFSDWRDELEWEVYNEDSPFEMQIICNFDLFNNIDSIVVEFQTDNNLGFTVTADYGVKYKLPHKYNSDDGQDIEKLDEDDYENIGEDIGDYLKDYIDDHDDFDDQLTEWMEDAFGEDGGDMIDLFLDGLVEGALNSYY